MISYRVLTGNRICVDRYPCVEEILTGFGEWEAWFLGHGRLLLRAALQRESAHS